MRLGSADDGQSSRRQPVQATNWGLRGSELIENLNLSRRFSLAFTAELTWTPAAQSANGSSAAAQTEQLVHQQASPGEFSPAWVK